MSNSLRPHGLYSLWNSLGQNTGVGSLSLLQGIFPTQGLDPGLPHCRWILYQLSRATREAHSHVQDKTINKIIKGPLCLILNGLDSPRAQGDWQCLAQPSLCSCLYVPGPHGESTENLRW